MGKTIISTRPLSDNDNFKLYLEGKGFKVIDFPMIEIFTSKLDKASEDIIQNLNYFDWLIFTSKNGVEYFREILDSHKIEIPAELKIAVIGNPTAESVKDNFKQVNFISTGNTSLEFVKQLRDVIMKHQKILLILGVLASDNLETGLKNVAEISRINVYNTRVPDFIDENVLEIIKENSYDLITFTSPSQVKNFMDLLEKNNLPNKKNLRTACIGKTTENEILNHGLKPMIVANKSNAINFAKDIEEYFDINFK